MRKIFLVISLLFLVAMKVPEPRMFQKSTILMDTLVAVTVVAEDETMANEAIDSAFATIGGLEKSLSFWTKDSEIAAIGKSAGGAPVKVSRATIDVVDKALMIATKTNGAFDPTVGPLMRLWDFKKGIMPTQAQIREKLPLVGYDMVMVNGSASTVSLKKKGMAFDTGGIAKGYASDRAAETLKAMGIKAGLISVAGDIRAFGLKPDGTPWRVGIKNPRSKNKDDEIMAVVELHDMAISTSGDYERFFFRDGVRYHHIMNPKTGQPARGFISVSIIAPEAVLTDGFSTGIFALGPKDGLSVVKKEKLGCVAMMDNGEVFVTGNIASRIQWKNLPKDAGY